MSMKGLKGSTEGIAGKQVEEEQGKEKKGKRGGERRIKAVGGNESLMRDF
jgi:hypothetical protein